MIITFVFQNPIINFASKTTQITAEYFEALKIPFAAVLAYKSRNTDDTCIYKGKIDTFKKQYDNLLNFYKNYNQEGNTIHCYSIINDAMTIQAHGVKKYACGGGVNLFAITDSGHIFTCEHLAFDPQYAVGNIASGVNKKRLKEMQPNNVNSIIGCEKCWIKYYCS